MCFCFLLIISISWSKLTSNVVDGEMKTKVQNVCFFKHSSTKTSYDLKWIAWRLCHMKAMGYKFQITKILPWGVFEKTNIFLGALWKIYISVRICLTKTTVMASVFKIESWKSQGLWRTYHCMIPKSYSLLS